MSERKQVEKSVSAMIAELKKEPNVSRFSKSDFQGLVYAILADKDFKATKYLAKSSEIVTEDYSINEEMREFMDKLLKHAGMSEKSERASVIESFEFNPKDIEWVMEAVDEAMWQYTEAGKTIRVFRDKMLQLAYRKMVRSGKYNGKITYKKSIIDKAAKFAKIQAKAADADKTE